MTRLILYFKINFLYNKFYELFSIITKFLFYILSLASTPIDYLKFILKSKSFLYFFLLSFENYLNFFVDTLNTIS